MKKTLIAVPSMDMVSALFAQSLACLKRVGQTYVAFMIGSLVYDSRNNIVKQALAMDVDYIMWFDSDMIFPYDFFERMQKTLEENDFDILTGLYFKRGKPFSPVLYSTLKITEQGACIHEDFAHIPDGIFEVEGCGFGGVLMKTEVLKRIKEEYDMTWFSPMGNIGEDLSFCLRARELGYKIYCDPSLEMGHVGNTVISRKVFEALGETENGNNTDTV